MGLDRLNILVESRIRWKVYVRFGGECLETDHSNMERRRVLSLHKISNGCTENEFIRSYNKIYSEFSKEVLLQGIGFATIPLGIYILIQNSSATNPEYIYEILGGLGMTLGGGYALNKGFKDLRTKRYCKKYLTNLGRLK